MEEASRDFGKLKQTYRKRGKELTLLRNGIDDPSEFELDRDSSGAVVAVEVVGAAGPEHFGGWNLREELVRLGKWSLPFCGQYASPLARGISMREKNKRISLTTTRVVPVLRWRRHQ